MSIKDYKKIHFIGIGGIGISAIAKFLKAQGFIVSGSDCNEGSMTKELKSLGIPINIPHNASVIKDFDLVVHSAIIKEDNEEIKEAKRQNIPVLSRKEMLPLILQDKKVYAVAGAHGKSTTTAILSAIMQDFSALIGAESKEFKSNTRALSGNGVVFEADESDKSFLECNPTCAIVTNAEPEHMETYGHNLEEFYKAYYNFLKQAKKRVINAEDKFLGSLDLEAIRLYPSKDISEVEYFLKEGEPRMRFRLQNGGRDFGKFEVYGLGEHILIDAALAILSVVDILDLETLKRNLQRYRGIKKRFDILAHQNCIIIDDYAHHPTEIKATLEALQKYKELVGGGEIQAIWQPHKYSRVLDNLEEFVECFRGVSKLIILPVYAAGEKKVEIDFKKLFASYNPIFADYIQRDQDRLIVYKEGREIELICKGIVIGFNAGDLTYQLRGGI